jgi:hypothetical protein
MPNSPEVRTSLLHSFEALQLSRHKQVGLRALIDAEQYAHSNPDLAFMRLQTAAYHLAFAKAVRR